jgi:hypothetical protein
MCHRAINLCAGDTCTLKLANHWHVGPVTAYRIITVAELMRVEEIMAAGGIVYMRLTQDYGIADARLEETASP